MYNVIVSQFINNNWSFLFIDTNNTETQAKDLKESIMRTITHNHRDDQIIIENDKNAVSTMKKFGPIKIEIKCIVESSRV